MKNQKIKYIINMYLFVNTLFCKVDLHLIEIGKCINNRYVSNCQYLITRIIWINNLAVQNLSSPVVFCILYISTHLKLHDFLIICLNRMLFSGRMYRHHSFAILWLQTNYNKNNAILKWYTFGRRAIIQCLVIYNMLVVNRVLYTCT